MEKDKEFLLRAITIADDGISRGGGPFGAVITKEGIIISESNNRVVLTSDPTAHAEILAIRQAASVLKSHDLSDCTLFCSCEPCPMCLGAIYWAGIKRVVYDSDRTDAAEAGFNDNLIYTEIRLAPPNRKISFARLRIPGRADVFATWKNQENKIPY